MKTPFSVDDLYLHKKITDIAVNPAGDAAVCTVRTVDREANDYRSALWSVSLSGAPVRRLTAEWVQIANTPRWAPDGQTVAFVSGMTGTMQVHAMDRNGANTRQCGEFDGGASDFRWFPDGSALLVASGVAVDPDLRGGRAKSPAKSPACTPEVAWKLPYKSDGVGYLLGREIRLYRLNLATGQKTQLTDGAFDVLGFDVSADSQRIAYTRTRDGRFAHCSDLWVCNADGTGHTLLVGDLATVATPAWSPDGRWIAFTGARREGDGQTTLWLYEMASGRCTLFASEDLEIAAGTAPHWSDDSQSLVFVEAHRGRHRVVVGDVAQRGTVPLVTGDRQLGALDCRGGALAYTVDRPDLPSELWTSRLPTPGTAPAADECKLTDFNPWWRERTGIAAELRAFDVPDGLGGRETIEGWLLSGTDTEGPAPLLNDAHGGPSSYALLDFDSNVFWQTLCAQGWRVLALNAVGSSSYGPAFCERLSGHWGEYDLPQHLAAIDQLAREGLCDERLAVAGKSYGGFFGCWAIGHTDRFKAAVVMAPVGNIETHYGTSDGGYYADPLYLDTAPVFDRVKARAMSPLQYVEQATTPTLFLQGKDDERCPKCQSEELFVSMMRAGDTPAELVLYPDEGHSFLGSGNPSCRADASQRIVDWVTAHAAAQTAPSGAEPENQQAEESLATAEG